MKEGWVKLNKCMLNWEWCDVPEMVCVWIHMLLHANFADQKFHGEVIKRGSFVIGRDKFAKECGVSVQQLRTAIDRLENSQQITRKSTNKFTIITICNWDKYQDNENENNQQITNQQPTNNHDIRIKEDKNISLSARVREDVMRIGGEWNAHVNVISKQITRIDESNPERQHRVAYTLGQFGYDTVMTVIRKVGNTEWLKATPSITFDWAICNTINFEKILGGFYDVKQRTTNQASTSSRVATAAEIAAEKSTL